MKNSVNEDIIDIIKQLTKDATCKEEYILNSSVSGIQYQVLIRKSISSQIKRAIDHIIIFSASTVKTVIIDFYTNRIKIDNFKDNYHEQLRYSEYDLYPDLTNLDEEDLFQLSTTTCIFCIELYQSLNKLEMSWNKLQIQKY